MTVVEYIKAKNKLTIEHTGVQLVPDDQIVDLTPMVLDSWGASTSCPYCRVFLQEDDCTQCPMAKADNECSSINDKTTTWSQYRLKREALIPRKRMELDEALRKLVEKYNKSNNFTK